MNFKLIAENMELTYHDLNQKIKDGIPISKQDQKFLDSYTALKKFEEKGNKK